MKEVVRFSRTCLALSLVFALSSYSVGSGQDVKGIAVSSVSDWAVHPKTGRVFASILDGNEVIEFSTKGEVRRLKFGSQPDEMVIKGDLLVVACSKSPSLYAFNLNTNQEHGVAQLNGKGPYAMFCSQAPDDNYVYCICNTGGAWSDGHVFQVDTRTMKVRKQAKIQKWGQSHAMHVAMSHDGKWIVPDARGQSSPSGADLMKVNAEALTFTQVRDYHASFGPIVAGPMNRYWTFGNALYTFDISKKVRNFTGHICAIHPKYDLVASCTGSGVAMERLSDSEPIGQATIEFPYTKPKRLKSRSSHRNGFEPTVAFDLQNDLVFVGAETGGDWIDLKAFRSDLRPLRMIIAPSSQTILVDKPMRVPLEITNSTAGQSISLAITEGPSEAKIVGGNLTWTPTAEDLGMNNFNLAIKNTDGKEIDSKRLTVEVTLPKVELDFVVKTMKLSPNGQTLVAWGAGKGQENRHPAHTGRDAIAVIDLKTSKTIAKKELPQGIRDVAIDDKYIFICPASGNVLYRLTHRLDSSKRQFLQGPPSLIEKISRKTIAVKEERSFEYFDTDKMTSVKIGVQTNQHMIHSKASPFGKGKVAVVNGCVRNRTTGELLRVSHTTLPTLASGRPNNNAFMSSRNVANQKAWGRQITNNGMLSNVKGSRIAQPSNVQMATISEDYPVGILVSTVNEGRVSKRMISYCSLIDGTILQASAIKESASNQRTPSYYGMRDLVIAKGKQVLIALDNEIHVADIPDSIIKSARIPVHFLQKQKTSMQVGKMESFPLAIGGNREGTTFSLMYEYEGISLDESSGVIQVDTNKLWDNLTKQAPRSSSSGGSRNKTQPFEISANSQEYKTLTGKTLAKGMLAAQLPVNVALRDSEGQEDVMNFVAIVVGSRASIEAATKKAIEERERLQAEARKRQEEMMRARAAAQKAAIAEKAAPNGNVDERLDEIEARMRRIEAALDAVLKKLEEK